MNFKITTLRYPSGWVAVAQSGLTTIISDWHNENAAAIQDVKNRIKQYLFHN